MRNLKYAVSLWNYIHYYHVPVLGELFNSLRTHGYGVELWNAWRGELDLFDTATRNKIKPYLSGMQVSVHTDIGFNSKEFHTRQIDAAVDLGAKVLVLHSDNLYIDGSKQLDLPLTQYVVEYGSAGGLSVALENGQLPFLKYALEQIEGLDMCLDVGHVYLVDETMQDFMDTFKDRITHLHIQETLSFPERGLVGEGGIIIDHYTPGTGGIPQEDWALFLNTMDEVNFDGMAVFEVQPRNPLQTALLGKNFLEEFQRSDG
ncbi:MAG TPA: sugar phosphate isomerase/epimerase [Anaerolineales bacterium]|nr:sugar phosphate isomerase/epimerase [Anaerolineales bacterium]